MITVLDVRGYNALPPEGQADVDAFVESVGVEISDTYKIRLDLDGHGLGVTLETLTRRDGSAFIGMDGLEVAAEANEYLRVGPGVFVHVRARILN